MNGYRGDTRFPFSIPLFRSGWELNFNTPIQIVIGDNGSGKSTLLEAIAVTLRLPTISSFKIFEEGTYAGAEKLSHLIKRQWRNETHNGMFFRAEDYMGFVRSINTLRDELNQDIKEMRQEMTDEGFEYARAALDKQVQELQNRYNGDLSKRSHGEGFLDILSSRIVGNGVYLLDEPEASLSPMRQLTLISILLDSIRETDSQFIIATHSPIIMGIPDAELYQITDSGLARVDYEDTEHYQIYRSYLEDRNRYLRYL